MVLYHKNWQFLSIPETIVLFESNIPDVTFLPSSTIIYKLKSIKEGSCEVLENRNLFTIYHIPQIKEIYKVEDGKTTLINNEEVQPNYINKTIPKVSNFYIYDLGGEFFIENLNKPRFKALIFLEDEIFKLKIVVWIDDEPKDPNIADSLLKEALSYLKKNPPIKNDKLNHNTQKFIESISKGNHTIKPNFCIYNLWGESFIEHLIRPRFKALIILNDEIINLKVVVWIDDEPKDPNIADSLLKEALKLLKENLPKP